MILDALELKRDKLRERMFNTLLVVFMGLIVCGSCQDNNNTSYSCHTGDACNGHTSISIINNVLYCCNPGDGISIGNGIILNNGVYIGKRTVIINQQNQLNCVCTVTDPKDLEKLQEVEGHVNDILQSVGQSLNQLENSLNNMFKDF
ncbi:hypothetical protein BgiMline_001251 [Biomphalaria glabrata]|uniref:Uncharacterized protein LOC106067856 isoform X1 n=1 Tax=Biomphalaria glabrata TaxID=6526 RepID=A0A9W2YGJ4_BIOGL|nr:uncharacterized protein LOC106067856 isoform X1 [Biomphalaria glabrata]KAI8769137.1 hypothetical protein BgiMline_001160 [Biomphalaria glabrata]